MNINVIILYKSKGFHFFMLSVICSFFFGKAGLLPASALLMLVILVINNIVLF